MDADASKAVTEYIATFWTHFAAMSSLRDLRAAGIEAQASPVPRALSSSCGTCVRYAAEQPCIQRLHRDFERVVVREGAEYRVIAQNDEVL